MSPNRNQLEQIARLHGLGPGTGDAEPWIGATSQVYPWGETVIKVPLDHPDALAALITDATMSGVARGLGVMVPELLALDVSHGILTIPYAIYRRVPDAVPLQDWRDRRHPLAWRATGRGLALVHQVTDQARVPVVLRSFRQSAEVDPRPWIEDLVRSRVLMDDDARWLTGLLQRPAPIVTAYEPITLCHGDVNAANVLVDRFSGSLRALIDWAGTGWLDPAWDFAAVPLEVVPHLLAGHREVAPMPDDASAEARICWCQVQTRLHQARKQSPPSASFDQDLQQIRQFAGLARL